MANIMDIVPLEYDKWKNTPPNMIQRGVGTLFLPVEFVLSPFIAKAAPLFEGVIRGANSFVSEAVTKFSGEVYDITSLSNSEFEDWFRSADNTAKKYVTGGIGVLTAEGAGTGLGGFALLAADIPASFGLILGFANKIAITYQLDVTSEAVQVEILKAITAGSETNLKGKIESIMTLRYASNIICKQTWKAMNKAPKGSVAGVIAAVRGLLKKLGINVTKRKAGQLIPVIGAVTGGVINGAWASDSLEAVRQYCRMSVIKHYKDNSGLTNGEADSAVVS